MSEDQRLAQIAAALEETGLPALVMGGHAVRYYGVGRNTADFDFYAGARSMQELRDRLERTELLRSLPEGPSWRREDFARFALGRLADGREEWVEFWLYNHLLPDFSSLSSRAEKGVYGGRELAFLPLTDLLRSKETERETDWQDIALLEEVQDSRNLANALTPVSTRTYLSNVRSLRGFEGGIAKGAFDDLDLVSSAAEESGHPVSFAWLAPLLKGATAPRSLRMPIDPLHLGLLKSAEFASPRHRLLAEVVRRAYKRWAMEADRLDKQSRLNAR